MIYKKSANVGALDDSIAITITITIAIAIAIA